MDQHTRQALFTAFDPQQPLRRDTAGLYVPRAGSVTEELMEELSFSGPRRFLLAGAVGSGKSTELYRFLQQMEGDARRVTLLVDLFAQFDVRALTAGQVVFLVATAILGSSGASGAQSRALEERLARVYRGLVEDEQHAEIDLAALLSGLATAVAGIALSVPAAAAATAAGALASAAAPRLSLPGSGRPLPPNAPQARELIDLLRDVVQLARERSGKRLLVLVDGLDKVRDEEQIRDLFCSGVLSCREVNSLDLVFSAPPSLRFQVGFSGGEGFQMLRLGLFGIIHRDGSMEPSAYDSMWEVLRRRIISANLDPAKVLPGGDRRDSTVDVAIEQSGGLVRDFMHIFRRAVVKTGDEAGSSLRPEDIDAGIQRRRLEYLDLLDLGRENLLIETLKTKQRPGGDEVDHLLNDNLILIYDNGAPWCRPHPMVLSRLEQRSTEERRP
ncbi:MAG: hypothetical protein R3F39_07405 [Myxococcota bacterium]